MASVVAGGTGAAEAEEEGTVNSAKSRASLCTPGFRQGAYDALQQRYRDCLVQLRDLPASTTWVDSHVHFESIVNRTWNGGRRRKVQTTELQWTLPELIETWPPGMEGCVCNCCFPTQWDWLEENIPHFNNGHGRLLRFTVGLHPHMASQWCESFHERIRRLAAHPCCVGIGECGIDAKMHTEEELLLQEPAFRHQIALALQLNKTLVVHLRGGDDLCLRIIEEEVPKTHPVHMHCFSGAVSMAERLLASDRPALRFGFAGNLTYMETSQLAEVVAALPLDRLLLETDGPYLAPEPFRGQTSHSGLVHLVCSS
eukprot:TRINITY_DN29914_c0_g1_i8.p1 TRINITY_DN29914_c0_g1~~TRINITY_DN29914_c0_g1_i8.p1  ORF type:complete len:313 (-),score=32.42 TRINITY_DN29914_c0_g1_i8:279-1217(-)